jgi:hypothetical protein
MSLKWGHTSIKPSPMLSASSAPLMTTTTNPERKEGRKEGMKEGMKKE